MQRRWLTSASLFAIVALLAACANVAPLTDTRAPLAAMQANGDRMVVVTVANETQMLSSRAGSTFRGYDSWTPYRASASAQSTVDALAAEYHMHPVASWPIAALQVHCVVFDVGAAAQREQVITALTHDRRVKLAQPLQSFGTLASAYNDPYVGLQAGFSELDVAGAHEFSRGAGIRVAVIDTGVDVTHPDLNGRVITARNFVDKDTAQFERDRHGTEVAGVIAAVANNKQGIVGVAPEVKLIALKACWPESPDGEGARCNSFTLAKALAAAIDEQARIVNLSLGGPSDALLDELVKAGQRRGMIFVGAVPTNGRTDGFPTSIAGVLAVNNAGATAANPYVLLAPGREILTLTPGGHYDFASGSSIAAAHVTGTIALLLAEQNKLDADHLHALLERTRTPLATHDGSIINACKAVSELTQRPGCKTEGSNASTTREVDQNKRMATAAYGS